MPDAHELLEDIRSADRQVQGHAFEALMAATDSTVDWADDAWDHLVADLGHRDNRTRAIAAQVLCNLAKSIDDERVLAALPELMAVTHDERFVTSRHCLQSLWKLGATGQARRDAFRQALAARFAAAGGEKNGTLIRADIIESLRRVHDATGDQAIHDTAEQLIGTEPDDKYRRKYTKIWKAGTAR
jgi:hypothetical protein